MRKKYSRDDGIDSFISIKSDVFFAPIPIYLFEAANELLNNFGMNNSLDKTINI